MDPPQDRAHSPLWAFLHPPPCQANLPPPPGRHQGLQGPPSPGLSEFGNCLFWSTWGTMLQGFLWSPHKQAPHSSWGSRDRTGCQRLKSPPESQKQLSFWSCKIRDAGRASLPTASSLEAKAGAGTAGLSSIQALGHPTVLAWSAPHSLVNGQSQVAQGGPDPSPGPLQSTYWFPREPGSGRGKGPTCTLGPAVALAAHPGEPLPCPASHPRPGLLTPHLDGPRASSPRTSSRGGSCARGPRSLREGAGQGLLP